MKYLILKILGLPIVLFFKLTRPIVPAWKRVYYTSGLMTNIKDMDYSVQCDGRVHVSGTRNISIGKRCRLGMETELMTSEKGRIQLGDDIRLNRGCTIVSYSEVSIGDFTIIGEYVSIRDANHGMERNEPIRYQKHTTLPIRIDRDVWIGRGCCILPGVTIGEGSIIGANSVINKDIPPYSIAAGVPAKVLRQRE